MDRATKLSLLLLTCPLLACSDDVPGVPGSTGEDSTSGSVDPSVTVTITDPDPDTTASGTTPGSTTVVDSSTTVADETEGTTTDDPTTTATDSSSGDSSSGDSSSGDSSSGDSSSSSTTDPGSSSSTTDPGSSSDATDPGSSSSTTDPGSSSDATDPGSSSSTTDPGGSSDTGTMCGDGVREGDEQCDDSDFGDATCESIGFPGGQLACNPDCTFNDIDCSMCGNGVLEDGELCDGADLDGADCTTLGFMGGILACGPACSFDTSACDNAPPPGPGEVVITEIMQNPSALADGDGEWFELYNPAADAAYQLGLCTVEGAADAGFIIEADLVIGPEQYVVIATDSMVDQGFVPDYQWVDGDYGLSNGSDEVRLVCSGLTVDEVAYDNGATFPDPNGASMNLNPETLDAVSNDDGTNWCEGSSDYNGDLGTPGGPNTVCLPPVTYPIDFCRLQFPNTVELPEGSDVQTFGRVYIAGLTDLSGVNDPAPEVFGAIGYGPDGSDPAVDPGWVWTTGFPNFDYGPASPSYEENNDEYTAQLSVPGPPGEYDFAFRFSGDSGLTFTYCDGQPEGNSNGYDPADAGQMTSQAAPVSNVYFSEYVEGSSNNKALEIFNADIGDADLNVCEIQIYANGGLAPSNTIDLSGFLAAGDTLVVCDDSFADLALCDITDGGSFFNGDDAIELRCGSTTLDIIGEIGVDPGSEWFVDGVGTQDETIRRDCAVTMGNTAGGIFDPSLEWASFPLDDFSDLGQYLCP